MEAGGLTAENNTGTLYSGLGSPSGKTESQVFDLVIDPLTDFKGEELSNFSSSPQESYNLTLLEKRHLLTNTKPIPDSDSTSSSVSCSEGKSETLSLPSSPLPSSRNLLDSLIDSHLWTSDVSIANGSSANGASGTSKGVGANSNHRRLVVAEVHRFGYHPPCAGSPHDLASCPVAAVSVTHDACQSQETTNEADPLKVLSQASSALALTETLIGPLRIPPVSREILDQVFHTMEKKTANQLTAANGGILPPVSTVAHKPIPIQPSSILVTSAKLDSGKILSSLQPRVHQLSTSKIQSCTLPENNHRSDFNVKSVSSKDIQINETEPQDENAEEQKNSETFNRKNSRVITVPVGMSDHGPVEVYREVHQYPAGVITTTVEKRSYIGQTGSESRLPSGPSKRKCRSRKLKQKRAEHHASQSSVASGSSVGTSVASESTLISQSSSELTPITHSQASSSKASLSDTRSDSAGPVTRPVLSTAIFQMRHALEHATNSTMLPDNHSDKSSGGADISSNFSDTSSNLSTLSDLSGYEDEYIRIKRLVSDAIIAPDDYKKLVNKTNSKSTTSKSVPIMDYEKNIRDLQAQKEDLEIQLHRLSIQVQNAVREKELYQQQLELMQTKITETNQKQYFEVLKQRANLEGQLEMLKQELENTVYEKTQLQSKISETLKESQVSKNAATDAKNAESQMSARLQKYEETNKTLEENHRIAEEKIQKLTKDYENSQWIIKDHITKNEHLEMRLSQCVDGETHMKSELDSMRSRISQLQEECEVKTNAQIEAETAANRSAVELQNSNASSIWYQEQLQNAQNARTKLQQELLDVKSKLAKVNSENDNLVTTVQTMKRDAEDGQARAVREKASLVAHLESLQADMAEREALVSQLERDRGSDTKLMEDRRQRLEQDRQRIHKLRLDLADTERQLDYVRDDLKHKCTLLARYENELKELRTSAAINQEVIGERDVRISNLEQTVEGLKQTLHKKEEDKKISELAVNTLKEEKLKIEIKLAAANNEKKEVDDAIIKVREDMTKLSSNFYRMKHDLSAKDRQIELCKKEAQEGLLEKALLEKKIETLENKTRENEEKKKYLKDIEILKRETKELLAAREKSEGELIAQKQMLKSLEIEKKGLGEAVRLREEQIQNMQGSVENYREAILKKDEELYVAHERSSSLEKTYMELRREWETMKDETLALRQDAEAYIEHEKLQKREKSELKESIQKERKLKQNMEKKIESLLKTHETERQEILREKGKSEKLINDLTKELQVTREEKNTLSAEKNSIEEKLNDSMKENLSMREENNKLQSGVVEEKREREKISKSQKEMEEIVSSQKIQFDSLSKIHNDLKTNLEQVQEEKEKCVLDLKNTLKVKVRELESLKKSHTDSQSLILRINQEKNRLSEQVSQLLAENTHMKKMPLVDTTLAKGSSVVSENKEGGKKKGGKNVDNLLKEILALHSKIRDSDLKLNEVLKQKEELESAAKSNKKESLLMRAKMKEFESLKSKCKELEVCKNKLKEYEAFNLKLKDLETKIEEQEKDISALNVSLNETSSQNQILKENESEFSLRIDNLNKEKEEFQEKISSLEQECKKSVEDNLQYQTRLKHVEAEKDEWIAKFESLRDFIPERDTSTQPAVQLELSVGGRNVGQQYSNEKEMLSLSVIDHDNAEGMVLGKPINNIGYICEPPHGAVANGTQFDKTMADLQAQVSLTSKALQVKEKQIQDLQHAVSVYKQEAKTTSANTSLQNTKVASNLGVGDAVPDTVYKKRIDDLLQKIEQLRLSGGNSVSEGKFEHSENRAEIQMLSDRVKSLEYDNNSKNSEIEEVTSKLTTATKEFKEKQRRYESNVRLLTRKLKEHMKGRKSAEKYMQTQAEDHQRILNEEQQRYSVLRCRYIELEGRSESLEGQVSSLEGEVEEVRTALERSRQESYDHHDNTLQLQKEIGRLQELEKTSESLRQEVSTLKDTIILRDQEIKKMEHDVELSQEQLRRVQTSSSELHENVKAKENELEDMKRMREKTQTELRNLTQTLKSKEQDLETAKMNTSEIESKNAELQNNIRELNCQAQETLLKVKKLEEEKSLLTAEVDNAKAQLQESVARIFALDSQVMVVEGQLKVYSEEVNQLKEQLASKVASHQVTVEQLEQSIDHAKQEVVALTTQLSQVQRERVSYQTQAVELRTALHSALGQLNVHKAEREAQEAEESSMSSEAGVIPSPSPLDLTSLTQLMEKSARPPRSTLPLTSLETCLSSLKQEVAILQTQLQNKQEALAKGSILDITEDSLNKSEAVLGQASTSDSNQSRVHAV